MLFFMCNSLPWVDFLPLVKVSDRSVPAAELKDWIRFP